MRKIILKFVSLICCILFLTSFASASLVQYTRFSDFEYLNFNDSNIDSVYTHSIVEGTKKNQQYTYYVIKDTDKIQKLIDEGKINNPTISEIVQIEICIIEERETKINPVEKTYLKNVTKHGKGYFKDEQGYVVRGSIENINSRDIHENVEQDDSDGGLGVLSASQEGKVSPYLRNTSYIPNFIILKNIISDTDKNLKTASEYNYSYIDNSVEIGIWDMYSYVTFETYNIFKSEWEAGELYIPEGTVYIAIEWNPK